MKLSTAQQRTIEIIKAEIKMGEEFTADTFSRKIRIETLNALEDAGLIRRTVCYTSQRSVTRSYNFGRTKRYRSEAVVSVCYELV